MPKGLSFNTRLCNIGYKLTKYLLLRRFSRFVRYVHTFYEHLEIRDAFLTDEDMLRKCTKTKYMSSLVFLMLSAP
jgi:hypothetical protein